MYILNKKLIFKIQKERILQITDMYVTDREIKIEKDLLGILNTGNSNINNQNLDQKLKMLEFFNFSNYSSFLNLKKEKNEINDFNKKTKNKYILKFKEEFVLKNNYLKTKEYSTTNNKLNLKYNLANPNNLGLYLKNLYFFKYLNLNKFIFEKKTMPAEIPIDYLIVLPFSDWGYSWDKIKIVYRELGIKDNNYFDMQRIFAAILIIQNITINFFYRIRFLYHTNNFDLQI